MVFQFGDILFSCFFIFYFEGILMKYMVCISFFDRRLDTLELIQDVVVFLSRIIPSLIILIQVFKFDVEDSCLQTIQSGIETDDIVVVPGLHAMIGDDAYFFGEIIIICEQSTPVSITTKIFGWKK